MKTFLHIKSIVIPSFLVLFSFNSIAQKYHQIDNTLEICKTQEVLNNMLLEKYNEDVYSKTGVITYGFYNNIVVMSGAYNYVIDIEELFKAVCETLKANDIDYGNIRYLICANFKYENMGPGDVIAITGKNFMNNIDDYKAINYAAIKLSNTYNYQRDPDLRKIVNSAMRLAVIDRDWGPGKREKRYLKIHEGCMDNYEKVLKKQNKK